MKADRQDLIGLPGAPTETTCRVLVAIRHQSEVAPAVTVTCNGVDYVSGVDFTLAHYGTDHADGITKGPLWTGVCTVAGLSSFTQYPFSLSGEGYSNTGMLKTAPADTDDFCMSMVTCFRPSSCVLEEESLYDVILDNSAFSDLPVSYMLHVDDLFYGSQYAINDTEAAHGLPNPTELSTNGKNDGVYDPSDTDTEFDWALVYMAGLGMIGPALGTDYPDAGAGLSVESWTSYACRINHRIEALRSINGLWQWGDWEIQNDVGWDKLPADCLGFAPSSALWDATFGAATGNSAQNNDSTAKHWAASLGALRIVALDCITNSDAEVGAVDPDPAVRYSPASIAANQFNILGNNQVLDILEAFDTDHPFKLMALPTDIKYPATEDGVYHEIKGVQHPLKNHSTAMYSDLMTKDAPHAGGQKSLMLNPKTNGAFGSLFALCGDYHNFCAYRNHASPAGNELGEEIVSINAGTINNSGAHGTLNALEVGVETEEELTPLALSWDSDGNLNNNQWVILVEVFGSRYPKECHIKVIGSDHAEGSTRELVFHKKFVQYRGNFMLDPDYQPPLVYSVSDDTVGGEV